VIGELEDVSQCAVIGVPDSKWGEVGLALVVLRPGAGIDTEAILARCRASLARYKVPRRVEILGSLPCSPQGKVLKSELRRHYAQEVL
jgi:fatty-acyl-CoA synthase